MAFAGLHNLSMVVDGQDLVGFEFVLGFAASATLTQRLAKAFAAHANVVELTNFVRLQWYVDVVSNNVLLIEIRFPSCSRFVVVAVASVVAATRPAAECS